MAVNTVKIFLILSLVNRYIFLFKKIGIMPGVVVHACNPSIQGAEVGGS
jgi:hypothetical protein